MKKTHFMLHKHIFLFAIWLVACGGDGSSNVQTVSSSTTIDGSTRLYGLNFGPYLEGQDPNMDPRVDEAQLLAGMEIIRPHTQWIRTYGSTAGLEKSGKIARSLDLKAALGAWISRDLNANENELENLLIAAKAGEADMLIVGSEVLLRRDISPEKLIDYIKRVKQEVPSTPITYADRHDILFLHPAVIEAIDVVFVNYYPYWEGVELDIAVAGIHQWHKEVKQAANGKPVIISETGWPSDGRQVGPSVASLENANFYFLNFVSWARANGVKYFYFEAFDEDWKVKEEGPQGAHWEILDKFGNLKPGMERVLSGETMQDNWSKVTIPGGPGTPAIEFTHVPAISSFDDLEGRTLHLRPASYKVAVYIFVPRASGWWTKPYFDRPLSQINIDGSWRSDITTGGIDQTATKIAAFLLPNGIVAPKAAGSATLPSMIEEIAVAKVQVIRD